MTGGVRSATDRDFSDLVLGAANPVLVCFERGLPPIDELELLAREFGWLTCVRVDVDRWTRLAGRYGVTESPTLVLFEQGTPVLTLQGARALEAARRTVPARAVPPDGA